MLAFVSPICPPYQGCFSDRAGWCPGNIACHQDAPCDQDLDATSWFPPGGTYDVDYADVLGVADSKSKLCLVYAGGKGAAIQRSAGKGRLVYLGFPIETIRDPQLRGQVMAIIDETLANPTAP